MAIQRLSEHRRLTVQDVVALLTGASAPHRYQSVRVRQPFSAYWRGVLSKLTPRLAPINQSCETRDANPRINHAR